MRGVTKRLLAVVPDDRCTAEVGAALWGLEEARRRTLRALDNVPDELVDWISEHDLHSLGTLLYHIAAIEADWLYADILQIEFPPEIAQMFPHDVRDVDGRLTPVSGESIDKYLQRLAAVRTALLDVYRPMTTKEFQHAQVGKEYDVTPGWVIFHLTQHEAEHRAEIASLRDRYEEKFGRSSDAVD